MKSFIFFVLLLSFYSSVSNAESCNDLMCQPMTAKNVCDWTRNHPIDRTKLHDQDFQAVVFDSCVYLSRIECAYLGESVLEIYKTIFEGFTGDGRAGLPTIVGFVGQGSSKDLNPNIFDNFIALQKKHQEAFSQIDSVQNEFIATLDSVKTAGDAKSARYELEGSIKVIQSALYQASYYDSIFLKMLEDAGSQLLGIGATVNRAVNDSNCKVLNEPFTKLSENSKTFFQRIDELRKFVGIAAYKRNLVMEKFKRGMELGIYRAHANFIGQELNSVMDALNATFKLDAILWEVSDWWLNATQNGLANRLHTKYLQYRKPLQLLGTEMGRAETFKARIQALNGIDEAVKASALGNIDENIKEIQKNIDFITKRGGWAEALAAQKKAASKRAEAIPATNTACHRADQEFVDLASKASDINGYELAEAKYKAQVDNCVRK